MLDTCVNIIILNAQVLLGICIIVGSSEREVFKEDTSLRNYFIISPLVVGLLCQMDNNTSSCDDAKF